MSIHYNSFLHLLFISFIALFPAVNPIGSAFLVSPFFTDLDSNEKKSAVRKITCYAFCICIVALFAGRYILELFGISIPVIQLGGGLMICKMGWEFISGGDKPDEEQVRKLHKTQDPHSIENKLFYPITFPVTTGGGTIAVLFTLSAHSVRTSYLEYLENTGAILLAIISMCVLICFFYNNTKTIIHFLGSRGEMVINRISAFLIFCVGLQIAIAGITTLIKS
jgi:multiple antibiotic resistance protein